MFLAHGYAKKYMFLAHGYAKKVYYCTALKWFIMRFKLHMMNLYIFKFSINEPGVSVFFKSNPKN